MKIEGQEEEAVISRAGDEPPTEHCTPSPPHPLVVMVVTLQYREMMYLLSTDDLPQSTPEGHRREGQTLLLSVSGDSALSSSYCTTIVCSH